MASIIVTSPTGEENHYPLPKRPIVIGRGEQVPVQVLDDHVSTKHLQIRFDPSDGCYHALDMKSKNGTMVNNRSITGDITLADGDMIRIGDSTITFYEGEFADKTDAFKHHKQAGQRDRQTFTFGDQG